MTPPARPTASLAPVCSGCQCVLISVWMRLAAGRAPDGREQRIRIGGAAAVDHQRAVGPGSATTLPPAPWSSDAPPRSVVVMRGSVLRAGALSAADACRQRAAERGRASDCRKRRRDSVG